MVVLSRLPRCRLPSVCVVSKSQIGCPRIVDSHIGDSTLDSQILEPPSIPFQVLCSQDVYLLFLDTWNLALHETPNRTLLKGRVAQGFSAHLCG